MKDLENQFVFVAMPFSGEDFTEIYGDSIRRVVEECGLKCKRADEIFDADVIIESIENDIRDSLLVIADLTGKNPNVFYEVGYARALDKEVVLLTQSGDFVPFDLKHRRYIQYGTSARQQEEFRERLRKTLQAVVPRAQRTESFRHSREASADAEAEIAALRQLLTTGFQDLRLELRTATQNAFDVDMGDAPTPVFHVARLNTKKASCQSHLKQLGLGAMQCLQDYNEKFFDSSRWQEALLPYVRNAALFTCPGAPELEFGFAMNAALSGLHVTQLYDPSQVPLFFDSSLNRANASGGVEALCNPPRHLGKNNIVFADGHVTGVAEEEAQKLVWNPL